MKIERHSVIAGQGIKTVRDMLRDLGRYDQFGMGGVIEHLQREGWYNYIDELAKQGRIPPSVRTIFRRNWRDYIDEKVIYRDIRVKKQPNHEAAAKALIRALLADGVIEQVKERNGGYRWHHEGQCAAHGWACLAYEPCQG